MVVMWKKKLGSMKFSRYDWLVNLIGLMCIFSMIWCVLLLLICVVLKFFR